MKNAKINVIHFDSADVIATSGFNGYYLSGAGTSSKTDNHFYQIIDGITQTTDEFNQLKNNGSYASTHFVRLTDSRAGNVFYANRSKDNADIAVYNGYYIKTGSGDFVWQGTDMPNQ